MIGRWTAIALAVTITFAETGARQDPTVEQLLGRMSQYVATYGDKAALIVSIEKYMQSVTSDEGQFIRPRSTVAEFAVVKTGAGPGWVGYRDVVEVDGTKVGDRRDRLMQLFTAGSADAAEITRIANESARYNIGPVARNFNVPTTTLLFFQPGNLARFKFTSKGSKKIDGSSTWQLDFVEVQRPTLVMTRAGKDVPIEGSLWIVPQDGTVVRTRLRMKGFADDVRMPEMKGPAVTTPATPPPPPPPTPPAQGATGGTSTTTVASGAAGSAPPGPLPPKMSDVFNDSGIPRELVSRADIEVSYKRDEKTGMWVAVKMSELYEGPIARGTASSFLARSVTVATYSDFKQFDTGVKLNIPK